MTEQQAIVFVVDDDKSVRESLESLIRAMGLGVEIFSSAQQFLSSPRPDAPGCLVLDVRMPGLGGLDLQQQMAGAGIDIPIVFITGFGDIPMSVQAMKAGAVEFLTKPFREADLLDAIEQAIGRDRAARRERAAVTALHRRYQTLTHREREILELVTSGLLNKQTASRLGISEITVKIHRAQVMQKMQAASLAELVRMSERLRLANIKS